MESYASIHLVGGTDDQICSYISTWSIESFWEELKNDLKESRDVFMKGNCTNILKFVSGRCDNKYKFYCVPYCGGTSCFCPDFDFANIKNLANKIFWDEEKPLLTCGFHNKFLDLALFVKGDIVAECIFKEETSNKTKVVFENNLEAFHEMLNLNLEAIFDYALSNEAKSVLSFIAKSTNMPLDLYYEEIDRNPDKFGAIINKV